MSNLLLSIRGPFAQFERELIRERQRERIAIARREGKYLGRKPSLIPARAAELRRRVAEGDSKAALAREFGISGIRYIGMFRSDAPCWDARKTNCMQGIGDASGVGAPTG